MMSKALAHAVYVCTPPPLLPHMIRTRTSPPPACSTCFLNFLSTSNSSKRILRQVPGSPAAAPIASRSRWISTLLASSSAPSLRRAICSTTTHALPMCLLPLCNPDATSRSLQTRSPTREAECDMCVRAMTESAQQQVRTQAEAGHENMENHGQSSGSRPWPNTCFCLSLPASAMSCWCHLTSRMQTSLCRRSLAQCAICSGRAREIRAQAFLKGRLVAKERSRTAAIGRSPAADSRLTAMSPFPGVTVARVARISWIAGTVNSDITLATSSSREWSIPCSMYMVATAGLRDRAPTVATAAAASAKLPAFMICSSGFTPIPAAISSASTSSRHASKASRRIMRAWASLAATAALEPCCCPRGEALCGTCWAWQGSGST
mmetsp:Transcript_38626/g.109233  ORF Transcript_38626/g.109233 Transcript_38626/m.109233 type:complete len:378 (-) Transcript_38626:1108-2241(-)